VIHVWYFTIGLIGSFIVFVAVQIASDIGFGGSLLALLLILVIYFFGRVLGRLIEWRANK
jgi:uncharacterized membrane protein YdcZ (DUF606 family)